MVVMKSLLQRKNKHNYIGWSFLLIVAGVVVAVAIFNRGKIYDWYRSVVYRPTAEMVNIRDSLGLTGEGEFLFNAVQPVLNEAEDFNRNCRKDESDMAVLGCYVTGNIYVYNITSPELNGIRELTVAHELLHAKWERMSETERLEFVAALTQVFDKNQDLLEDELLSYDIDERQEELYVRAGTEVKNLPDILEKHFAKIFKDQDKVVDFYESYIAVFRDMKARMETLEMEMESLRGQIEAKTAEYEQLADQLTQDIVSFNNCAEAEGCFYSEYEFYRRRNELIGRQESLGVLNDEINESIDEYNARVDEYNSDITESRKLQDMINSNKIPEI